MDSPHPSQMKNTMVGLQSEYGMVRLGGVVIISLAGGGEMRQTDLLFLLFASTARIFFSHYFSCDLYKIFTSPISRTIDEEAGGGGACPREEIRFII